VTLALPSARWRKAAVGALALAALLGIAHLLPATGRSVPGASGAARYAPVVRTTLVDSVTVSGTLGFGDAVDAQFISRARSGIVTWIAPEGSVVERGEPLFAIDGQPVVLFYGDLPPFRSLRFHGDSFGEFEWLELDNARDEERRAELELAARRAQQAEAAERLAEMRAHVADSGRDEPRTPQFVRLAQAVAAARDRLRRIEALAEKNYASAAEVQDAAYGLAAAQAELDAARRERQLQLAAAEAALAEARLAVHRAERALRDARDARDALLASSNDDADVAVLRANLAALGFEGPAAASIRRWQHESGRSATGLVEPGHIVVAPGPVRIAAHLAGVGDVVYSRREGQLDLAPTGNTSSQVLRYTSTARTVTVPLELADLEHARQGDEVTITLPTGAEVRGVVRKVGRELDPQGRAEAGIDIPDQQALGSLEAASVDVEFTTGRREDVLAVPITALLALPGGGYGVEVTDGNAARLVEVETGLFAGGMVEVSGEGIAEGMRVRVP
jgi:multidrug efflux pump subunit AcrA (membrane-fusion protein)